MATITGTSGDDTLFSTPADDTINGLAGNDTVSYANITSHVTIDLGLQGSAQNTTGAGMDTLISIENVIGTAFDDILHASSAGGGALYGGGGDDTIYAGAGADTIDGGAGNNWADYYLGGITSGVTVNLNLQGSVQNTGGGGLDLLNHIQNIQGSGFDDLLIGDAGNNNLQGRAGDDTLDGGAGDDTLAGGPGVNTASYADAPGGVTVSLALQGAAQNTGSAGDDTLYSFQNLIGSAFDDTLTGDANNNALYGGAGDDTLNGGLGSNTLDGGAGNNTASYTDAAAGVTVSLALAGSPQNTGGAGDDTLINIQNLTGSFFADSLTGDAGNNVLNGGTGADSLYGGAGDDTLIGGFGDDRLDGGTGIDTASYANAPGNSLGQGVTVNLGIGTLQNTVNAGSDVLVSIENLIGSAFDDTLTGNGGANVIYGGAGNDLIGGSSGNDTLYGGDGADTLKGGSGDDTLIGGAGADKLAGGGSPGHDTFLYTAYTDSLASAPDKITDFVSGIDKIDLSQVDADTIDAGQQHFHIVSAYDGSPGELAFNYKGNSTWYVQGDVNGDGKTDFFIIVHSTNLVASDFIL